MTRTTRLNKKWLYIVFVAVFVYCFQACATSRIVYDDASIDTLGFNSEILKNPKNDKARIYVLMDMLLFNLARKFSLGIEFNPTLDSSGQPNARNYQDVLGLWCVGLCFM